jgi:hypothetical protein
MVIMRLNSITSGIKNNVFTPSGFPSCLFAFVSLMALAGCADTELPKWLSNEPTREELAAYKGPIDIPPADGNAAYPNLADVPKRPVLTPVKDQQALVDQLQADNVAGKAAIADYSSRMQAEAAAAAAKLLPKTKLKRKKKP